MKTKTNKSATRSRMFQWIVLATCTFILTLPAHSRTIGKIHFSKAKSELKSTQTYLETAIDKKLEIENWMTDDVHFGALSGLFQIEIEAVLEIEPWMTSEKHFANCLSYEKELEIEPWMTDDYYWLLKTRTPVLVDNLSNDQSIMADCK
ncbi:MAG TPA: hypothetical protein VKA27_17855 [Sunxiuqinia sp.]|nr:hypothetical protein [Sunxiuqinia sp.]